ncbi:integrase core domain-containing protein [Kribbella pittospori]|uniref:integrase core domain-containing protein n=1 Tax=Kribbella pittospori TaxID=722689 RepID=UPI00192D3C55
MRAQTTQPTTIAELQVLLDSFVEEYNQHRPHRSLPHRCTPATAYAARPKAAPSRDRTGEVHHRVRTDRVDDTGVVTLRVNGRLHHIGIGRTHARTYVLLLIHDLQTRVVDAATGELLRDLVLDPSRDYQPTGKPPRPTPKETGEPTNRGFTCPGCLETSHGRPRGTRTHNPRTLTRMHSSFAINCQTYP